MSHNLQHTNYNDILQQIITEIKSTRIVLAQRVNSAMMDLYWNIGKRLSVEGLEKGYGASVVKRLSVDLQQEFPDTSGFSTRNLWNMKNFYEFYALADTKVQQLAALLPWMHNILIISKVRTLTEAEYYLKIAHENSMSRNILLNFIKADSYKNTKILPKHSNFEQTLQAHLRQQADEILKSTYNLEMLGLKHPLKERELEHRLVEKIKLFLLELGTGFTFIGN
jgi:predicted nuclease of restriction endonuclease-like (RecB) superfamily